MNPESLIEQYLRLQRKLAMSQGAWHSGRLDQLSSALKSVEQQLRSFTTSAPLRAH